MTTPTSEGRASPGATCSASALHSCLAEDRVPWVYYSIRALTSRIGFRFRFQNRYTTRNPTEQHPGITSGPRFFIVRVLESVLVFGISGSHIIVAKARCGSSRVTCYFSCLPAGWPCFACGQVCFNKHQSQRLCRCKSRAVFQKKGRQSREGSCIKYIVRHTYEKDPDRDPNLENYPYNE